jgi:hypothetical protein
MLFLLIVWRCYLYEVVNYRKIEMRGRGRQEELPSALCLSPSSDCNGSRKMEMKVAAAR